MKKEKHLFLMYLCPVLGGSDGVPWDCNCVRLPPDPAEVGQEKNGIVGGDTGPTVPYASYIFYKQANKKNFLVLGVFLFVSGDLKGSSGVVGV